MGKRIQIIIAFLLLYTPLAVAQTVNKGEMIIEEGTNDVITFFDFINKPSAILINNDNLHIKADFVNEGKVSYNEAGTVLFSGGSKQSIDGGTSSLFHNIVFDNSTQDAADNSAFTLSGEINVEGEVKFREGIINNRAPYSGVFTFLKKGKAFGANDKSYVSGKVEKVGNAAFEEFPIGAFKFDQYRYAGISAPSDVNHSVVAEYLYENSNTSYPHDKKDNSIKLIDNKEYWDITGTNELILTLSWDDDTTPREFLENPDDIRIAHWNATDSKWENLGGIPDSGTKTIQGPVRGEGIFTLALVERDKDEGLIIYNAISPNDDDLNDRFLIEGKDGTKINRLKVKIYNRWGVLVFESDDYQSNRANTFFGYSEGRVTVDKEIPLPKGTYFYILDYDYMDTNGANHKGTKVDYLYITNDPTVNGTL